MSPEPAIAVIGARLLDRVDDLAVELTDVIRRVEPTYDRDKLVPVDDLRASVRDNLVYILGRLTGRPTRGLGPARATGRRRTEQNAPLRRSCTLTAPRAPSSGPRSSTKR